MKTCVCGCTEFEYEDLGVFWDNYIARCAKAIHSYLCDDPMDYCVVSDNGISFVNKSFNGNDEMEDAIYEIRRNKDALVWTRYNN